MPFQKDSENQAMEVSGKVAKHTEHWLQPALPSSSKTKIFMCNLLLNFTVEFLNTFYCFQFYFEAIITVLMNYKTKINTEILITA